MMIPAGSRIRRVALFLSAGVLGVITAFDVGVVPDAFARGAGQPLQGRASDSADVLSVVARYSAALASGDSAAALALLAPDAVVLESGGLETRDEYRARHLPADIGFARAVTTERVVVKVTVRGDAAWASSTSTTTGEYRGRPINSRGAELMVLSRESGGWTIRAIHWSSRNRATQ